MRILHLLDHSLPRHSAYAQRTMAILRQQRAMGWQTIQLTGPRQGLAPPDRNADGWHFFRTAQAGAPWGQVPLLRQLVAASLLARRLRQVIQLTRPDLLHAHSPAGNALAALGVGRRLGLPVLFEVHAAWGAPEAGLCRRVTRELETYAARRADAVATSSVGMRDRLQAGGVRRARLTVVPDAVSLRRFSVARRDPQLARQLGLGGGPVIGYVGPFHPGEGIELLLAALPALLQSHPRLQLLLAGAGPLEPALKARTLRMNLGQSVVFAGPAARTRNACHALVDVLVFPRPPARQEEPASDRRLLEAMAQGCLVAASDVGAHRELVEHGRTGILFEAGKPEALSDALGVLLAAPARWAPMRGAARWFVEYQRTWDVSVGRYAPVYQRLLERRRRP